MFLPRPFVSLVCAIGLLNAEALSASWMMRRRSWGWTAAHVPVKYSREVRE
jgi:hypothetical protein